MSSSKVLDLKLRKTLDTRAFIVFLRLQRYYQSFDVLSGIICGLALSLLSFPEFHPSPSSDYRAAEVFLVSSASTSVISILLGTMLLFWYEGCETATRGDLALAWTPLVTLECAILAFVTGLVLWYREKSNAWRTALVGVQTGGLLLLEVVVAFWMWFTMSRKGGLGRMESEFGDARGKGHSKD